MENANNYNEFEESLARLSAKGLITIGANFSHIEDVNIKPIVDLMNEYRCIAILKTDYNSFIKKGDKKINDKKCMLIANKILEELNVHDVKKHIQIYKFIMMLVDIIYDLEGTDNGAYIFFHPKRYIEDSLNAICFAKEKLGFHKETDLGCIYSDDNSCVNFVDMYIYLDLMLKHVISIHKNSRYNRCGENGSTIDEYNKSYKRLQKYLEVSFG